MAYLAKSKKDNLRTLAEELGLNVTINDKVSDLKKKILNSDEYDEEFVKQLLQTIEQAKEYEILQQEKEYERLEREKEYERQEKERAYELEKLRSIEQNDYDQHRCKRK